MSTIDFSISADAAINTMIADYAAKLAAGQISVLEDADDFWHKAKSVSAAKGAACNLLGHELQALMVEAYLSPNAPAERIVGSLQTLLSQTVLIALTYKYPEPKQFTDAISKAAQDLLGSSGKPS